MSTVTAYVRNVMLGPAAEQLERRLIGQFKVTDFEIQSMHSASQDAFIGLLQARIVDTIGRMADVAIGRDDVRDYSHMRGEFPRITRESRFWRVMGGPPVLDFERWDSDAAHLDAQREYQHHAVAGDGYMKVSYEPRLGRLREGGC